MLKGLEGIGGLESVGGLECQGHSGSGASQCMQWRSVWGGGVSGV